MTDSMSLSGPSGKGVRTKLGKSVPLAILQALLVSLRASRPRA